MTDTFGSRLAQARREYAVRLRRDVTGPELAERVGVSASAYYKWEHDEKRPRAETVAELAKLLGVTPGWLDYGQEPKHPAEREEDVLDPSLDRKLTAEELARAKRVAAEREGRQGKRRGKRA